MQHLSVDRLEDFARGQLTDADSTRIEAHLAECDHCLGVAADTLPDSFMESLSTIHDSSSNGHAAQPIHFHPGYEILEELGRGGMGVVYKARQISLNRIVALKRLKSGQLADRNELARFKREARAAARLHHSNIVPVHEVGEQDGQPHLAMEWINGPTLARRLADAPMSEREAAHLVRKLALAVQYAHERGVTHRDLKPGNILLAPCLADADGRVVCESTDNRAAAYCPLVADFGMAKATAIDDEKTQTGTILGTPSYMAPEQVEGREGAAQTAVDVYALGAILYECLTGRPPFRGSSVMETLQQVREQDPLPFRTIQPGVNRDLQTICLKSLHKNPGRRYTSARDLAGDLERFLDGRAIQARPVGILERGWKWAKRRPDVAAFIGLILVSAIAGILATGYHLRSMREETERANRQFIAARETVRAMVEELRTVHRASHPRLLTVSLNQAEQALAFLETSDSGTSPVSDETVLEIARLRILLGELYSRLNRQGARECLEIAENSLRPIALEPDAGLPYQLEYGACLTKLGIIIPATGPDHKTGESYLRDALRVHQSIVDTLPSNLSAKNSLAWSHHNLGAHYLMRQRHQDAEEQFDAAIRLREPLLGALPDDDGIPVGLAGAIVNNSVIYAITNRRAEAYAAHAEAQGLLIAAGERRPNDFDCLISLASSYLYNGHLLREDGQHIESIEKCNQGIACIEAILHKEPDFRQAHDRMFALRGARGQAYAASADYAKALVEWDHVVETAPESMIDYCRSQRAYTLAKLGRWQEAARDISTAARSNALTPDGLLTLLRAASLVIGAVKSDTTAALGEQSALISPLEAHASRAFIQLSFRGFLLDKNRFETFQKDENLKALRSCPGYRKLENEFLRMKPVWNALGDMVPGA